MVALAVRGGEGAGGRAALFGRAHRQRGAVGGQRKGGAELVVATGNGRLDEGLDAPCGARAAVDGDGAAVAGVAAVQRVLVALAVRGGEGAGGRAVLEGRAHRQRGAVGGQRKGGAELVVATGNGRLDEGLDAPCGARAAVDGDGAAVAGVAAVQRVLVALAVRGGEGAGGRAVLEGRAHRQRGAIGGQRKGGAELVAATGNGRLDDGLDCPLAGGRAEINVGGT